MLIYTDGRDVGDSACYLRCHRRRGDRAVARYLLSDVFFTEITSCGSQPCPTKNAFGVPIKFFPPRPQTPFRNSRTDRRIRSPIFLARPAQIRNNPPCCLVARPFRVSLHGWTIPTPSRSHERADARRPWRSCLRVVPRRRNWHRPVKPQECVQVIPRRSLVREDSRPALPRLIR